MSGWAALAALGVVYDAVIIKRKKGETLSHAAWAVRDRHGWLFGGLVGAALGHFLLDGRLDGSNGNKTF